ncbi:MAG: hypothetical protein FJ316_02915 [SAR202 cluster bacterium]|nr:hypothetical protein [SAR202 cluster bacterium]
MTTLKQDGPGAPLAVVEVDPAVPPATLSGRVGTPSSASNHPALPLELSFWAAGAVPTWRSGAAAAPLAVFHGVNPDIEGAFQIDDLSPALLPAGLYDLRVQRPGSLAVLAAGIKLPALPGAEVHFRHPPAGDLDGDNLVDAVDIQSLRASFGRQGGHAAFNPLADFNGDGLVDGQDFSLLARNYQKRGD